MKNFKPHLITPNQVFCIILCILFLCFLFDTKAQADDELVFTEGQITRIIDGDTFDVLVGKTERTCRLVGIDTPEKYKGKKLNADIRRTGIRSIVHLEAGQLATEYAENYFTNRFSPEVWVHIMDTDLYGRDLCIVASKDAEPSIPGSYNCHVLLDGYAVFYKDGKNLKKNYRQEFEKCEAKDSGLWEGFPVLMEKLK